MSNVVDFGNVKSDMGLEKLNNHMLLHSYVVGYTPSQYDLAVFSKLTCSPPVANKYPHAARWYRHIASFSPTERDTWKTVQSTPTPAKKIDDDFDLFGDETPEEASAPKPVAVAPKTEKKKKVIINKSQLILEVKPASLETNLDELEKLIKQIVIEGLEWSITCKKVPIAFGLMKLQIGCNIIDDIVDTEDIIEKIECLGLSESGIAKRDLHRNAANEDEEEEEEDEDAEPEGYVQSVEIVSFNKL